MKAKKGINTREKLLLEVISREQKQNNRTPSLEELTAMIGVKAKSHVHYCLRNLEKFGYIERKGTRYIKVLKEKDMDGQFETRDQTLFMLLVIMGHKVLNSEKAANGVVTFIFDAKDVEPTVKKYFENQAIPCDDVRRLFIAQNLFKSILRRNE